MAAFHFTAKIHSRAKGSSAVRAAAYRAAERLYDERLGKAEDYTRKLDVVETAILAPAGAPAWVQDREILWNRAEGRERRRDSQVAQELEINLPRELSDEENWRLITDFATEHLVAQGRVCDIAMHVHKAGDGGLHPHAHILMPVRQLTVQSFGEKHPDCDWRTFLKRRDRLGELREVWCDFARSRAAELGIDLGAEWDHRSFEDRGIDLEPGPKRGAAAGRMEADGTPAERTAEHLATMRRNGAALLQNPMIALDALTQRQSTFDDRDLARYIFKHSVQEQFQDILAKARSLAVSVGHDEDGRERFSTHELILIERELVGDAVAMADRHQHRVTGAEARLATAPLSDEQRAAAKHLLEAGDLACLVGHAGAGKSTMLRAVREELERAGYRVRGAALAGIAAESLQKGAGIDARTLKSLSVAWDDGRDQLTARDVLVIDEAGMVGSRQLAEMLGHANAAGAKVILVGDPQQLQAIDAGAALRAVLERTGFAELTEIHRQREGWQRAATHELATGKIAEALDRYRSAGMVESTTTDAAAKLRLVEHWQHARTNAPDVARIMLAHSRADVRQLNEIARGLRGEAGELGPDHELETSRGTRAFAAGDRLLFLRNERNLGVKNGTLGTITEIEAGRLAVMTDDGRTITVDPQRYKDIDHGYAVTVHKSQGVTVDESFVLASRGFDRHLAYVALSRHRERVTLVHSQESFKDDRALNRTLARARPKDTTLDYREAPAPAPAATSPSTLDYPAPKPTDNFIRSHQPARSDEIAGMFDALAETSREPERTWEIKPREPGWGM